LKHIRRAVRPGIAGIRQKRLRGIADLLLLVAQRKVHGADYSGKTSPAHHPLG
jgi:hypothetical protein